jgi:hypothetical protein
MSDSPPPKTSAACHPSVLTPCPLLHPTGVTVDFVGTEAGNHGRSCEEHDICGTVLGENAVVRIRRVQIVVDGNKESALTAYWISDGIDHCHVRFLQHHLLKQWK